MPFKTLFLGAFLVLTPASLWSGPTTYYVDSTRGDDHNAGTSANSPWRTLAKVSASRFSPGDAVLLRRGSVWHEQLNFPSSGAAEALITIDAYGVGELPVISGADPVNASSWISSTGSGANVWQAAVAPQPNVVLFDGAKGHKKSSVTDLSSPLDWFWLSGTLYVFSQDNPSNSYAHPGIETGARPSGLNLTGSSYISVTNVEIRGANAIPYGEGAGIWAITVHLEGPTPSNLNISKVTVVNGAGDGIHIENADHCVIDSALVRDNDGAGIELYHSNGKFPIASATITNNQVHHNGFNGIFVVGCPRAERCRSVVYPDGLTVTGVKILGNTLHDNGAGIYLHETNDSLIANNTAYSNNNTSRRGEGYCVGLSGSSSNIVEKNNCYQARLSGIELSIDTGKPPFGSSNNIIRYNSVHDDGTHGIFTNYIPSQGNKILYNLIYNHPQGSCIMANYVGHEILNNTCYNSRIGIHLYISSTTQQTGNISIRNNLILRSSQYHVLVEKGVEGPFEVSNNLYSPDGEGRFNWKGSPLKFGEWRTLTGLDGNSLLADPQLASLTPNTPRDFTPSTNSQAVGHGTDLGDDKRMALSPLLHWPEVVTLLPQEPGRWDIGAFRHSP
jgi:parallel beta-helix repeat protein